MQMSPSGFQRWKEIREFLQKQDLDKMTAEARAEAIRGYAQMLRQSGYRVDVKQDHKSDVKVDNKSDITLNTTNAPTFNNYRSVYSLPPGL